MKLTEKFFIGEDFHDQDSAADWMKDEGIEEIEVCLAVEEPIVNHRSIKEWAENFYHSNEERFTENGDTEMDEVQSALEQSLDVDKFNELCPKVWYGTSEYMTITLQDLTTN